MSTLKTLYKMYVYAICSEKLLIFTNIKESMLVQTNTFSCRSISDVSEGKYSVTYECLHFWWKVLSIGNTTEILLFGQTDISAKLKFTVQNSVFKTISTMYNEILGYKYCKQYSVCLQ